MGSSLQVLNVVIKINADTCARLESWFISKYLNEICKEILCESRYGIQPRESQPGGGHWDSW